jgi:hypothetical protein
MMPFPGSGQPDKRSLKAVAGRARAPPIAIFAAD